MSTTAIQIARGNITLGLKTFVFNGGEVSVKLDTTNLRYRSLTGAHTITARVQSSADFMTLIMAIDALRRWAPAPIKLYLPYLAYGRQDRVCDAGESFSLKVFGNMINALDLESVTTLDPHSAVTEAVVDRLNAISQTQIVHRWDLLVNRLRRPNVTLISPDSGANKKTSELAGYLGHGSFLRADKLRDLTNGKIKETIVYADDLTGQEVAITDDLGDGMATFIPLAKALKAKGAARVILYITHGLFSRGADLLYDGGIDEVWCTNSFRTDIDPRVKVLDASIFSPS